MAIDRQKLAEALGVEWVPLTGDVVYRRRFDSVEEVQVQCFDIYQNSFRIFSWYQPSGTCEMYRDEIEKPYYRTRAEVMRIIADDWQQKAQEAERALKQPFNR